MNDYHDTLRSLNVANVVSKLRRLKDSSLSIELICRRINYHNKEDVDDLLTLVRNGGDLKSKISDINIKIRQERKKRNATSILDELRLISVVPIVSFRERCKVNWLEQPKHLVPDMMSYGTYLAGKRKDFRGLAKRVEHCARKRMQIEAMLAFIELIATPRTERYRILDICGGRGDLGLVLARMFPESLVTIMDRNKLGLLQVKYRTEQLGLRNVLTREMDLFEPNLTCTDQWDLIIGLHACGQLTDMILSFFGDRCAHLIIATCCFGKMENQHKYSRYADADVGGINSETSRLAKLVINSERCAKIEGSFSIYEMDEKSFSSKNQIIYIRK